MKKENFNQVWGDISKRNLEWSIWATESIQRQFEIRDNFKYRLSKDIYKYINYTAEELMVEIQNRKKKYDELNLFNISDINEKEIVEKYINTEEQDFELIAKRLMNFIFSKKNLEIDKYFFKDVIYLLWIYDDELIKEVKVVNNGFLKNIENKYGIKDKKEDMTMDEYEILHIEDSIKYEKKEFKKRIMQVLFTLSKPWK